MLIFLKCPLSYVYYCSYAVVVDVHANLSLVSSDSVDTVETKIVPRLRAIVDDV